MTAIDLVSGKGAGTRVIGSAVMSRSRKKRIIGEAIAAILGAKVRLLEVVTDPVRCSTIDVERGCILRPCHEVVIRRAGISRNAEFGIAGIPVSYTHLRA